MVYLKLALYSLVISHFVVLVGNILSLLVIPFLCPWYIAFPLCSYVVWMGFSKVADCPLTRLENYLRLKLKMPQIGGFISYYIVKRKWLS